MDSKQQPDVDDQPVAYDAEGRPLYHQPEPSPPIAPPKKKKNDIWSPELQKKHDESVKHYPNIQFAPTEYVVIDVQRTIFGLVLIWLAAIAAFVAILLFAAVMISITSIDPFTMFMIVATLGVICLVGGAIAQYVFRQNRFIITNERALTWIQNSPFSYHAQSVELEHVEDCSFRQNGPLQVMLNFGTIRLSTIGDEHTYLFTFVARPVEQFKIINKVVQIVDEDQTTKYRF